MKKFSSLFVLAILLSGCSTISSGPKLPIWETGIAMTRAHDDLGPVSVFEEVSESNEDAIQGLASYISKDGRISGQIPADIRNALEMKKMKYKDGLFDKLSNKAKEYGADAVINAEYSYVPPYLSASQKAFISAKGMMVKYKA